MLLTPIYQSLDELIHLLMQLSFDEYNNKCMYLSDASIGEHSRHIIEMFQCLEKSYDTDQLNYDDRKRSKLIQTDINFAIENINKIKLGLKNDDKKLYLNQKINGTQVEIETNYFRELLYNLEHCIHHQALIKVAVFEYKNIEISDSFGVARSTIEFRKQCVQ